LWTVLIWFKIESCEHDKDVRVLQSDRKVAQTIPDTCSICQKISYTEIRKQKTIILNVGDDHRVQRCMHSLRRSTGTVSVLHASCVTETVHQTRYCRFVWHRRIEKCIPKLILASQVRTSCQVVFDNEHSLHLLKRHPCTSTV
jgi:hypothetical protein